VHKASSLKRKRKAFATASKAPKRYGYTAAHRREDVSTYSTNLTDAEWDLVADLFERAPGQRGTPVHYSRRELVNARSYVLRTGCAWRLLPTTFPPWQAVYKAFARWVAAGVFEQMQDRLREQWRSRTGRSNQPTAAMIDAQSNRTSPQGGESGFDAAKKVKGRKRNLVVDTMGLVIALTVTAASVQDRDAAAAVVGQACSKAPCLERLYTDGAYGASALTISSSYTTSASKSYDAQETVRREPCTTPRKRPCRPQRLTRDSWSCQSGGWSSVPMHGLNAGVVR
jgi:putative transposase